MNRLTPALCLTLIVCSATVDRPANATDVSTLIPFVDQQTMIVLRVEPANLSAAFRERLAGASGFLPATVRGQLRRVIENEKIRQAYVVASLADSTNEIPFVVFRQPDNWNESDSQTLVAQTDFQAKAIGDAIIMALPKVIERLEHVSANPTSDVIRQAFGEAGDQPLQLALTLSPEHRRVIKELWGPWLDRHVPFKAQDVGSIRWAIVSANEGDGWTVRLDAQTAGNAAATRLWSSVNEDVAKIMPLKSGTRLASQPDRLRARVNLSGQWVNEKLGGWVAKAKSDSARKNLSRIGLAMHNYHSAYRRLPSAFTKDPEGKPLLSWRVQILAFLGKKEQLLFQQFRMDEPWDSPNNRALINKMPDAFRIDPTTKADGRSTFAIPVGPKAIFHGDEPSFSDIVDGLSNTVMVVEIPESRSEIWTKPEGGISIDAESLAEIGGHFGNKAILLWGDGSVREIDIEKHREILPAMFTRDGAEPIPYPID